jgi:hypothetical protein
MNQRPFWSEAISGIGAIRKSTANAFIESFNVADIYACND